MRLIREGYYKDYKYNLYDVHGNTYFSFGAVSINDNGYLLIPSMMEASKVPADEDDRRWSEMNEPLRKDVECLNGEFKQEFAILKNGQRYTNI